VDAAARSGDWGSPEPAGGAAESKAPVPQAQPGELAIIGRWPLGLLRAGVCEDITSVSHGRLMAARALWGSPGGPGKGKSGKEPP